MLGNGVITPGSPDEVLHEQRAYKAKCHSKSGDTPPIERLPEARKAKMRGESLSGGGKLTGCV